MSSSISNSDLEQLLNELKSDSAKRRWATIGQLVNLDVTDDRFLIALETLAAQDPMLYVREEAQEALQLPIYQAALQQRQAQVARSAAEQASKTSTPPTPPPSPMTKPPPPPRRPMPSSIQPVTSSADVTQTTPPPLSQPTIAKEQGSGTISCAHCGYTNQTGMKFCQNCGKSLIIVVGMCTQCGTQNASGTKFCGNCGNPLAVTQGSSTQAAAQPVAVDQSDALRQAHQHRGDVQDPKRMTVKYLRQSVQVAEDCRRAVNLLEFNAQDVATNYEKLEWVVNSGTSIIVRYGNRSASLYNDVRQAMDFLIKEYNAEGIMPFFNAPLQEACDLFKNFDVIVIDNIPIFGGKQAPQGTVNVYAPLDIGSGRGDSFAIIPGHTADFLLSLLTTMDAALLFEACMQKNEKFEIELVVDGQTSPRKRVCWNCRAQVPEAAEVCYRCNTLKDREMAAQIQGAPYQTPARNTPYTPPQPERWEFCEVVWDGKKSGAAGVFNVAVATAVFGNPFDSRDSHIKFWVKASSPLGTYNAGNSEWLSAPGHPDQRNRTHVQAVEQLVSQLLQEGWEPIGQGDSWYNARLRRRFQG